MPSNIVKDEEEVLQAVVLADSFNEHFKPLTSQKPRVSYCALLESSRLVTTQANHSLSAYFPYAVLPFWSGHLNRLS